MNPIDRIYARVCQTDLPVDISELTDEKILVHIHSTPHYLSLRAHTFTIPDTEIEITVYSVYSNYPVYPYVAEHVFTTMDTLSAYNRFEVSLIEGIDLLRQQDYDVLNSNEGE